MTNLNPQLVTKQKKILNLLMIHKDGQKIS